MTILKAFTLLHTLISLVAIVAGFVVVRGLIQSRGRQLWTFGFFVMSALTTLTGFLFQFHGVTPAFVLGVITIVPLVLIPIARYRNRLAGRWRETFVISVVAAFYFNFFVLVVQAFQKIPALHALAPTQTELPFKLTQLAALLLFVGLGTRAVRNFHPANSPVGQK